jgi:hypothetical protein
MIRFAAAALGMAALGAIASAQAPSAAEQARFLDQARRTALGYSDFLPDFVCTEVIHRSSSDSGVWRNLDSLTLQLTYANKKENYKVVLAGNKPSDASFLSVGGAISAGEFGSTLRWIFEPESAAAFHWEKSAVFHKTPVSVYSYRVPRARSHYALAFGEGKNLRSIVVGFHGVLDIANDTSMVLHLTTEADDIPPDFSIRQSSTAIDYGFTDVGGRQYLLPSGAETTMLYQPNRSAETRQVRVLRPTLMRNLVDFRSYRKFAVDSEIDFGGDGKP